MDLNILLTIASIATISVISLFVATSNNLVSIVLIMGVYSLFSAFYFILLDGVDVALTETAVNAGVSTFVLLMTLVAVKTYKAKPSKNKVSALIVSVLVFIVVAYGISDLSTFADPNSPVNTNLKLSYLSITNKGFEIPNVVTAVLGSFRGYDTMGETLVIFTAALGVGAILSKNKEEK